MVRSPLFVANIFICHQVSKTHQFPLVLQVTKAFDVTTGTALSCRSLCFHSVSPLYRFVDTTRRWEFEDAPLANYINFQLTAAGPNDPFMHCALSSFLMFTAVAAIVGSDIAPTCVAAIARCTCACRNWGLRNSSHFIAATLSR
jgi:hypothetical protein